jgi:hypothetical protein
LLTFVGKQLIEVSFKASATKIQSKNCTKDSFEALPGIRFFVRSVNRFDPGTSIRGAKGSDPPCSDAGVGPTALSQSLIVPERFSATLSSGVS